MSYINRSAVITVVVLTCVPALAGCSKTESSSTSSTSPPTASNSASLSQELGVDLLTQEQADARAAAEINAQNADQAFADLEREAAAEEP